MRGGEARPQEQEASSAQEGEGRPRAEVTLLSEASSQALWHDGLHHQADEGE